MARLFSTFVTIELRCHGAAASLDRPGAFEYSDKRARCAERGAGRAFRGRSSVGRALEWHSRGQGFDSPRLHQIEDVETRSLSGFQTLLSCAECLDLGFVSRLATDLATILLYQRPWDGIAWSESTYVLASTAPSRGVLLASTPRASRRLGCCTSLHCGSSRCWCGRSLRTWTETHETRKPSISMTSRDVCSQREVAAAQFWTSTSARARTTRLRSLVGRCGRRRI